MSRSKRTEPAGPVRPRAARRVAPPLTAIAAVVLLIATGLAVRATLSSRDGQAGAGAAEAVAAIATGPIVITPPRLDLGDVSMDVAEVPMSFEVTNTGERVAVITYIETSCDCTEATIVVDGAEGPRFAMSHGTPPGTYDWRAVLAPGETVTLIVYYDPQAHGVFTPAEAPQLHGPITRIVRLHSDDRRDPFVDLRIDLNQVH